MGATFAVYVSAVALDGSGTEIEAPVGAVGVLLPPAHAAIATSKTATLVAIATRGITVLDIGVRFTLLLPKRGARPASKRAATLPFKRAHLRKHGTGARGSYKSALSPARTITSLHVLRR